MDARCDQGDHAKHADGQRVNVEADGNLARSKDAQRVDLAIVGRRRFLLGDLWVVLLIGSSFRLVTGVCVLFGIELLGR